MLRRLLLLAALSPFAFADVQFISPAPGATLQAGKPITAKWKDSGAGTALTDLNTYTLFLCAGGNDVESFVSSSTPHTPPRYISSKSMLTVPGNVTDTISSHKRQRSVQHRQ